MPAHFRFNFAVSSLKSSSLHRAGYAVLPTPTCLLIYEARKSCIGGVNAVINRYSVAVVALQFAFTCCDLGLKL